MNDPAHPIWHLLRLAVVGIVMIVLCSTLYKNGFDSKDVILILSTLFSLAGFDATKMKLTSRETTNE